MHESIKYAQILVCIFTHTYYLAIAMPVTVNQVISCIRAKFRELAIKFYSSLLM